MREFLMNRRDAMRTGAAVLLAMPAMPRGVAAAGSTLRIRSIVDIQTLDPAFTYAVHEYNVNRAQLNNLITWKKNLSWDWELDAAAAIEQVDPTHVTFALRDDLGWTNGFGPMTADDVKFSFERIEDPELQSAYQADWALLDHVDVTGERTGTIVMKQPFAPLWNSTLPWVSGLIVCRKAVEALPGKRIETEQPATSGPYKVTNWTPKQTLTMGRNDLWAGDKPDFDEIVFFPIDEDKTAELGFEAGEFDFCTISISSVPDYRLAPPEGSTLIEVPALDYYWLGINVEHPKFQDIRVRHAVQYALDIPAILDAAFFGVVDRATGYQSASSLGHRDANLIEQRDLNKARALLAEAGVPDGFQTTLTIINATLWTDIAQVIQANLAEVGIEVEILTYDSGAFWTLGIESEGDTWKGIQMYLQLYNGLPDPAFQTQWFVPEQVGVWNWERWNSPEYKELNDLQLAEFDEITRAEYVRRMQELMEDSGAYTFLTNGLAAILVRDSIVPVIRPDGISLYLPGFKRAG
jgi:peptide/nickel transport system substrate-binding protein